MKFLLVKVPQSNEYSYEQSMAFLSSMSASSGGKGISSIIPFFGNSESTAYSLNIISIHQNIYFVVGTPDKQASHIKNQLLAQFGKADIINLQSFSDVGNLNYEDLDFVEVVQAKSKYLPIQTMADGQETDPLASILSTVSRSPDPNAIFWIQIILEPAGSGWQSNVLSKISKINAAESVSQSTQNQVSQMQEKIKYAGFKAYIRVITDSQVRTSELLNAFNVYASAAGNRLVGKSPNFLNKSKILNAIKKHDSQGKSNLLNTLEIATLWHMPNGTMSIPNIVWGKRLQLDAPENLPIAYQGISDEQKKDITFIGRTIHKNRETIFGVKTADRLRHLYIVGKTGTGKSWFIDNMAIEDIRKGNGVAVLDPHGDAIDIIMDYIPKSRINDVCYFNPADPEYAYPLNILEVDSETQKELIVSGIIAIFYKLYSYSWGPRMEHILRNVLFTLVNVPNATLPDILKILNDTGYRNKILKTINDPTLTQFWEKEYGGMSEKFANEAVSPIMNKVGQFVTSPLVRRVISYPKSKIRIDELMDNKKIFLCDLSQGKIGEDNAALLGSMIITKIQIAAMNRAFQHEENRVPFYLYVDEFQNFATQSFSKILSEARKYKLGLTLANQYITQIDEEVMAAILGNVGTLTCFNVGAKDSEILHKEFGTGIEPEDLTTLDKYQMIMRMMIDNESTPAFTYYSLPLPKNKSGHREKIIEQSRKRYGVRLN